MNSPLTLKVIEVWVCSLQLLTVLRKMCNSLRLLQAHASDEKEPSALTQSLLDTISPKLLSVGANSTKIRVLDQLLYTISIQTDEKVMIVSNFTSTLNLLANCHRLHTNVRLSVSTVISALCVHAWFHAFMQ